MSDPHPEAKARMCAERYHGNGPGRSPRFFIAVGGSLDSEGRQSTAVPLTGIQRHYRDSETLKDGPTDLPQSVSQYRHHGPHRCREDDYDRADSLLHREELQDG